MQRHEGTRSREYLRRARKGEAFENGVYYGGTGLLRQTQRDKIGFMDFMCPLRLHSAIQVPAQSFADSERTLDNLNDYAQNALAEPPTSDFLWIAWPPFVRVTECVFSITPHDTSLDTSFLIQLVGALQGRKAVTGLILEEIIRSTRSTASLRHLPRKLARVTKLDGSDHGRARYPVSVTMRQECQNYENTGIYVR